jgi:hypothetical protein
VRATVVDGGTAGRDGGAGETLELVPARLQILVAQGAVVFVDRLVEAAQRLVLQHNVVVLVARIGSTAVDKKMETTGISDKVKANFLLSRVFGRSFVIYYFDAWSSKQIV